jgi:hypothetical protein
MKEAVAQGHLANDNRQQTDGAAVSRFEGRRTSKPVRGRCVREPDWVKRLDQMTRGNVRKQAGESGTAAKAEGWCVPTWGGMWTGKGAQETRTAVLTAFKPAEEPPGSQPWRSDAGR